MGYVNGKFEHPNGWFPIAQMLGEASTDAGTICCSDKINDYSLIRPLYTVRPDTVPEHYMTANDWLGDFPVGHPLVPQGGIAVVGNAVDEYGAKILNLSYGYSYERKAWGYFVPYIEKGANGWNLVLAFASSVFVWRRIYPNADQSGVAADQRTFYPMVMFDRYYHTGVAEPLHPIKAHQIEYGKNVTVDFNVMASMIGTNDSVYQSDPEAIVFKGSIVNIPAVLGDGMYVGASLFIEKPAGWHLLGTAWKQPYQGNMQTAHVDFGIRIVRTGKYMLIPWCADKDPTASDAHIYPVRYASGFDWKIEETAKARYLGLTGTPLISVSKETGSNITVVKFVLVNPYGNYPLTASDFLLELKRTNKGDNTTSMKYFKTGNAQAPAGSSATYLTYDTMNLDGIYTSPSFGILTIGSLYPFAMVTVSISIDDANGTYSSPVLSFKSGDSNVQGGGTIEIGLKFSNTTVPMHLTDNNTWEAITQ